MNQDLNLKHLWDSLTPKEIEDGCRCLLEDDSDQGKKTRDAVLNVLAKAMRFRKEYMRRRAPDQNLPFLVNRINAREFRPFHDDVIRSWLIRRHTPMLKAFLEGSRIPHKEGWVDESARVPQPTQFENGLTDVLSRFKARDAGLYFGYLTLIGGEFWEGLNQALANKGVHILELLNTESADSSPEDFASESVQEECSSSPEDSDEFTTLDNWLIRTAVASAFGESGALSPEQLEDTVEEVISLNAQRQHTLFHRGYLHALFEKPFVFHFQGENVERRLWYFTGLLFGLLRTNKTRQVIQVLKERPNLFGQLCENRHLRCGSTLLPHVYPILWEAKEFGMCQRWLEGQLTRLPMERCINMMIQLHYGASALVRREEWAEAEGFLDLLDHVLRNLPDLPEDFVDRFRPSNDRKRAQVLQLKGDFSGAETLLKPLSETQTLEDAGNALCDLALMRAGFRSLANVVPTKDESTGRSKADALERGKELLQKAVETYGSSATNAHFCLGLFRVLKREDAQQASDELKTALAGMLKKEEAYSEGGLIQWTRFLLGLALLETAEPASFQYARDCLEQSIQASVVFPIWLWKRTMQVAALFDDQSLGQRIAHYLLNKRGADAYDAIWNSGLAVSVRSLRETYLTWLESAPLPFHEKWNQLKKLLASSLKVQEMEQSETILDMMEGLASQSKICRKDFVDFLDDERNYSPAWGTENAQIARVKLHELEGNFTDAIALLRNRFFILRQGSDAATAQEAAAILDWMMQIGAGESNVEDLRKLLQVEEYQEELTGSYPFSEDTVVNILYIGGNETQMAYEDGIRSELHSSYPGLKVEFYFPGWDSNWNHHLDRVRPKILQADAVVLSTMVRTQFGRHVRATCDSSTPWFPCTGKGKKSLKRSIENAAIWAANRKQK